MTLPRSRLTLDADDLTERVDDVDQVALGVHHGIDVLVGHGRFVDHVFVLAALDAFRGAHMVGHGVATLGFGTRHQAACAVTAATEALGMTLAAHDVRARAHAAGDDAEVAL